MIEPGYCLTMARYNAWQNKLMKVALEELDDAALRAERGAFFGSILKTANHLLWGDMLWMSRFDRGAGPGMSMSKSTEMTPTFAAWSGERFRTDGRILRWAEKVGQLGLKGDLEWVSVASGTAFRKPVALCVIQLFNHQTHHRGQIHAMVTAAGGAGWVTDLPFMPEQGPWL
ncbi:DinB family protein [Thalassovita sp.]|uniref:DinB family protein n=1 Tax=Thalassovita sp. TaxID=1979401 RepID=UPI002B26D9B6|nr:DinB family protein [Thalassovita sp.]